MAGDAATLRHATADGRNGAREAAAMTPPDWPTIAAAVALGLALIAGAAVAATHGVRLLRERHRTDLAKTAHANGYALLQLADDIELYAKTLALAGQSASSQRAWARLCRRVAVEHLACINALLLEPGAGAGFIGEPHHVAQTPPQRP